MSKLLWNFQREINDNMARFPKGCRRASRPIYLELKDFRSDKWKRPRYVKPGRTNFSNMFACPSRANALCKVMKKKLNVKDCRVKSYKI